MKSLKFNGDQLQVLGEDGSALQSFPASSGPLKAASVDSTLEDRRPVKTGSYHLREGESPTAGMLRFDRDGDSASPAGLDVLICGLSSDAPDDSNLIRVDERFFEGIDDGNGLKLTVSYEQSEFMRSTFVKE